MNRFLRFRLRTLLIVITVVAIPFGYRAVRIRREAAAIAWIEEIGGGSISYVYRPNTTFNEHLKRIWFGKKWPEWVHLNYQNVTDVSPLANLWSTEQLNLVLSHTHVRDLTPLENLSNLRSLFVDDTNVSPEQVERFRALLPNCRVSYRPKDQLGLWERALEDWRISVNRKHK